MKTVLEAKELKIEKYFMRNKHRLTVYNSISAGGLKTPRLMSDIKDNQYESIRRMLINDSLERQVVI